MQKITKIRLKNFRAFSNLEIKNINNFCVIVGKNDVGKSSILKALDIYCNSDYSGGAKVDKSDFTISGGSTRTNLSIYINSTIGNSVLKSSLLSDGTINNDCPTKKLPLKFFPVEDSYDRINKSLPEIRSDIEKQITDYHNDNDASTLRFELDLLFKLMDDKVLLSNLIDQLPEELKQRFYDSDLMQDSIVIESDLKNRFPDYQDAISDIIQKFREYDLELDYSRLVELGIDRSIIDNVGIDSIIEPLIYKLNPNKDEIDRLSIGCYYKKHLFDNNVLTQSVDSFLHSIMDEVSFF